MALSNTISNNRTCLTRLWDPTTELFLVRYSRLCGRKITAIGHMAELYEQMSARLSSRAKLP